MLDSQSFTGFQHHERTFDHVLEFPHISRPFVHQKRILKLFGHLD